MARYIDAEMLENEVFTPHIYDINRDDVIVLIAEQPTADVVEVKHEYWKRNESEKSIFYTCSCCNSWGSLSQKYCSECGAKMDGVKDA